MKGETAVIKAYLTVNNELAAVESLAEKGVWISLVNPTEEELARAAGEAGILPDFHRAALDEEERSRLEAEAYHYRYLAKTETGRGI